MPNRFSVTEKWKDDWFANLPAGQKLVYLFMIDNCDNAGFFEINPRINSFLIGIEQTTYEGAVKGLGRGFIYSNDGSKVWIKKFLLHQKNLPLNPENNAHVQIIRIIESQIPNFNKEKENEDIFKGLISPIGKGTGKDKGKEGGTGETKPEGKPFTPPTVEQVITYFEENGYSKQSAVAGFKYYHDGNWTDRSGDKVVNWKQKLRANWFKEENKAAVSAPPGEPAKKIYNSQEPYNPRG